MAGFQKLGCQKITTFLAVSFLSCNIERHMRYQIVALPEFFKMEFQNQLPWLPGCHGNTRFSQNLPTYVKFASLLVTIATTIIITTLHLVREIINRHLCSGNQYQMCAYFMGFHGNISLYLITLKCHLPSKVPSSTGRATLEPSLFWLYLPKYRVEAMTLLIMHMPI